jgi:hypothetical protein
MPGLKAMRSGEPVKAKDKKALRLHVPVCRSDEEALLWGALLATRRKRGMGDRIQNPSAGSALS